MMSPIPLASVAQLAGSTTNPAPFYETFVARINGIHNPDFQFAGLETDPRFSRVVALMTELTQASRLHWVIGSAEPGAASIMINHYAPTHTKQVGELLTLLGLPQPAKTSSPIVVPVYAGLEVKRRGDIAIATRSLFDLVEIMSAAVEVPEEDIKSGAAVEYPPRGLMGDRLRIAFAKTRPEHASVAVKNRGGWFYIDDRDQTTKRFFRMLGSIWTVTIAETSSKNSSAPLLTVPVSR